MSPVAKISRVLVGVDFDEASASALKMAGVFASAWAAEITVFHSARQEAPAYPTGAQLEAHLKPNASRVAHEQSTSSARLPSST